MKIFLVDDDEFVRTLLMTQLQEAGFDVVPETNVADAIKTLEGQHFDLLISDIIMPGKDGAALMKYARETAANMPILAITGGGENAKDDYVHYADFFADETMTKPIRKDALIAVVEKLISG